MLGEIMCRSSLETRFNPSGYRPPRPYGVKSYSDVPARSDNVNMTCWCGNDVLSEFGEGYLRCDKCQTLVVTGGVSARQADPRVRDEANDLYGRDYWFAHQTRDLNCPDITERSRADLSERCVHWLRTLLGFVLPPAKVLEIGCAHGGFVAMLRQAGFDACGLELSPSIVSFARDTFDVPVFTGPIEDQPFGPDRFDAVVMMDVMEHLPHPLTSLERCLDVLKPGGILLVQTPAYPEGMSLRQLRATGHKFPQMLDPNEHPLLYSRTAVRELFRRLGAEHIEFVPPIFEFYDMSFVVSRRSIVQTTTERRDTALSRTLSGRFIQAMLDLDERRLNLLEKYRQLRSQAREAA
jgi:SAM-dependent methyltransferase